MAEKHGSDHSTAGLSAERIGRNQAIFRAANERIDEVAEATEIEEPTPFICECADVACREVILMTLGEYSEIRQNPRAFLDVPGHEASSQGWGQVIKTGNSYVVVEKTGPAGDVAEQLEGNPDPVHAAIEGDERYPQNEPV